MISFFPTEFEFVLPKGLVDASGTLHRQGRMRLATAKDEIVCAQDPRVQADPGYATLVMLSAVITELGTLEDIPPELLENLYRPDFQYLKVFYEQIQQSAQPDLPVHCPNCQHDFSVSLMPTGEY